MLQSSRRTGLPWRRAILVIASVLGLVVAMAASVPTASAASYHRIKNYNGKCLDMTGGSTHDGAPPQIWSCNNNTQQYWTIRSAVAPNGTDVQLIINEKSNKCLSILDNKNTPGSAVIQWDCKGGADYWEDWQQDCSTGLSNLCYWINVGMAGGSQGPNGCCEMHPSGDGSSNGLKIYANIEDARAYLWTYTPTG